ncbi:hypothetical protein [Phreatobacter cathodiphilus]|jgi:hypothetical protein|uniref:hypothetical protein n=1 Tax=Phreatobacter cathodiphilus TaxID=1868589 RepID=UPI0011B299D0|nr:hypothetical protein [Phreatobacter cathodiphilus]
MSVFSKLVGVIDATEIQVLRQVIAQVRDEERIPGNDPEYSQAMADAVLAAHGRTAFEFDALKAIARSAVRKLLIEQAMRKRCNDSGASGAS